MAFTPGQSNTIFGVFRMKAKGHLSVCAGFIVGSISMVLAGLIAGCGRSDAPDTSLPAARQPNESYFKTPFQTEAQFVVENIVTDISEMVCFARYHGLSEAKGIIVEARERSGKPETPVYGVTVKIGKVSTVQKEVKVSGPIWSPAVYADLTAAIAASVGLQSSSNAPVSDVSMLDRLSDGLAETIATEEARVSTNLQRDFTNAGSHEEAAVLLGAFALRENGGPFNDVRLPLCRMTAHLALARLFAGNHSPGIAGRVADCMLLTLMNNELAALDELKPLESAGKGAASWVQTLRTYASKDFRPLNSWTNIPNSIERIAWFSAYSYLNNRTVAWERVGAADSGVPDFSRIAASTGYSVQMGNEMLQTWLPLELREIGQVYQITQGQELKEENLVASLNRQPDRCFDLQSSGKRRVHVIGWGLWALQLQHHLCLAISTDFNSLQWKLGLPDDAASFAADSEKRFGGLRFYPFVRRLDCTNPESYRKSTDAGWAFEAQYPHLTPMLWMTYLASKVSFAPLYRPIPNPHCNEWTVHNPLPGTAFDVDNRLYFPSLIGSGGVEGRERALKLQALAPYDLEVCRYIGSTYTNWTYEVALATFGPLLPYSAMADRCVADSLVEKPDDYKQMLEQACKWDPSYLSDLADFEWQRGHTNEAMRVYEREEVENPDALHIAGLAARRISYYLATGQQTKARQVADYAGEVYSYAGLAAKAGYFEQTGDLPQALDWFEKIDERYNEPWATVCFCARHFNGTGDAELDKKITRHLREWYHRQPKVTLAEFRGPPQDGVAIQTTSPILEKATLKKGDVLVALRGIRIHNMDEFGVARDVDQSPDITVIVWQDGHYREVHVSLAPNHRFGAMFADHKPGK